MRTHRCCQVRRPPSNRSASQAFVMSALQQSHVRFRCSHGHKTCLTCCCHAVLWTCSLSTWCDTDVRLTCRIGAWQQQSQNAAAQYELQLGLAQLGCGATCKRRGLSLSWWAMGRADLTDEERSICGALVTLEDGLRACWSAGMSRMASQGARRRPVVVPGHPGGGWGCYRVIVQGLAPARAKFQGHPAPSAAPVGPLLAHPCTDGPHQHTCRNVAAERTAHTRRRYVAQHDEMLLHFVSLRLAPAQQRSVTSATCRWRRVHGADHQLVQAASRTGSLPPLTGCEQQTNRN